MPAQSARPCNAASRGAVRLARARWRVLQRASADPARTLATAQGCIMEATLSPARGVPRQRWFLVALCLFFVAINVQYVLKIASSEREHRSAFLRWTVQIQRL